MKNSFIIGAKYNASQNISRLSLAKGNVPLFYQGLVYKGFDPETSEHLFEYQNETKWFDDDFINNGKVEDNSMIFSESESESVSSKPKLFKVSPEIQTSGTHYQGIIYGLTYQKIIDIFGEPCFTGEMGVDKVQADLSIEGEVNGEKVVATIYDYKNYHTPADMVLDWHIGGFNPDAVTLIQQILRNHKNIAPYLIQKGI